MTTGFRINGVDWDDLYVRRNIFTEGGLWNWGHNGSGQLGDNTRTHRISPVQTIAGSSNWKQVARSTQTASVVSGSGFAMAIKSDGTLWGWGQNNGGYLADNTTTAKSSPVQVVGGGTNWKQVALSLYTGLAIKSDGSLWAWGSNSDALGLRNPTLGLGSSPILINSDYNWKFIDTHGESAAGIKTDGTLWLWGRNVNGNLGDGTITHRSSPVQTLSGGNNWKQVAASALHSGAVKTDGTLWLWGYNFLGNLGTGNTTYRSSPVQTIAGGTNWKQVCLSGGATAAIKTDGTLWVWGENVNGELGNGTNGVAARVSSPIQTISAGTNWKFIAGDANAFAAIKTDGTLWTWGYNGFAQLGDNSNTSRSSPIQTVAGGNNWKTVAVGIDGLIGIREDFF